MDFNGAEYVSISAHRGDDENPGDARKVCAYRKWLLTNSDFLKVL